MYNTDRKLDNQAPETKTYIHADKAFLFSVNQQKVYPELQADQAMRHNSECGPWFGSADLAVFGDYRDGYSIGYGGASIMHIYDRSEVDDDEAELMGQNPFKFPDDTFRILPEFDYKIYMIIA